MSALYPWVKSLKHKCALQVAIRNSSSTSPILKPMNLAFRNPLGSELSPEPSKTQSRVNSKLSRRRSCYQDKFTRRERKQKNHALSRWQMFHGCQLRASLRLQATKVKQTISLARFSAFKSLASVSRRILASFSSQEKEILFFQILLRQHYLAVSQSELQTKRFE